MKICKLCWCGISKGDKRCSFCGTIPKEEKLLTYKEVFGEETPKPALKGEK